MNAMKSIYETNGNTRDTGIKSYTSAVKRTTPVVSVSPLVKQGSGGIVETLVNLGKDSVSAFGQLLSNGYAYVLAASVLGGAGVGWAGAKLHAQDQQDEETARKSYELERDKADINYLKGKITQEYNASKMQQAPKSARILG